MKPFAYETKDLGERSSADSAVKYLSFVFGLEEVTVLTAALSTEKLVLVWRQQVIKHSSPAAVSWTCTIKPPSPPQLDAWVLIADKVSLTEESKQRKICS